jgi:hypothetical protein
MWLECACQLLEIIMGSICIQKPCNNQQVLAQCVKLFTLADSGFNNLKETAGAKRPLKGLFFHMARVEAKNLVKQVASFLAQKRNIDVSINIAHHVVKHNQR